jgi:geranylgeranyl reductase family protein
MPHTLHRADVAVVGAGPAGAIAAWSLARAGARVRIFDPSHPREKPCGGGVTGRALGLLRDALNTAALPAVVVDRAEFDDSRTTPVMVPLAASGVSPRSALLVVDRQSFDAALLDVALRAGAVLHPERVVDMAVDRAGVEVRTRDNRYRADWLVGADGANSLARRKFSRPFARTQFSLACGFFAHGISSREILVRFFADPAGYAWSFPRRDHLAIGICAPAEKASPQTLRAAVRIWARERGLDRGVRLAWYSWPIPSLAASDFQRQLVAGRRWMLAGDAAGLVDPITREGIFFALESGLMAAAAIAKAGDGSAAYLEALRGAIYPELERAAYLPAWFFRSAFTRLLVDALRHSRAVREVMADLIAGQQSYRTLRRRLIGTCQAGLAWRLLLLEAGYWR